MDTQTIVKSDINKKFVLDYIQQSEYTMESILSENQSINETHKETILSFLEKNNISLNDIFTNDIPARLEIDKKVITNTIIQLKEQGIDLELIIEEERKKRMADKAFVLAEVNKPNGFNTIFSSLTQELDNDLKTVLSTIDNIDLKKVEERIAADKALVISLIPSLNDNQKTDLPTIEKKSIQESVTSKITQLRDKFKPQSSTDNEITNKM